MLSLSAHLPSQEPLWIEKIRKIEILKSQKSDVERLLDSPKLIESEILGNHEIFGWRERVEYEIPEGKLEVYYSTGRCAETDYEGDYDVERGVILGIKFEPRHKVPLEQLQFNYKTFDLTAISGVADGFIANNRESGVRIYFIKDKLKTIEFNVPTSKNHLSCDNIPKTK